jgi:hypothetical protein
MYAACTDEKTFNLRARKIDMKKDRENKIKMMMMMMIMMFL